MTVARYDLITLYTHYMNKWIEDYLKGKMDSRSVPMSYEQYVKQWDD